ncbi:MAG: hypothetical protein KGN02_04895 [bacterium]|nr:hypothetical protein [bacterium]
MPMVGVVLDSQTVDTRIPFIGRESELQRLRAILKRGGAVTLVGPGGVGKSRLALEAAQRFERDTARRTVFISLVGVAPEAVIGTAMAEFGVALEGTRDPLATLQDALRGEPLVVLLDNCEHVPDEAAALVDRLRAIDGAAVIATSQQRLDYTDEEVLPIEPFGTPSAVAFFCARTGRDETRLSPEDAERIRTIVKRLDGLAIALDLAAARLASLSLEELSEELAQLKPYQLRSTRGTDPRHRTIGNVIAWSHARSSADAQELFALVSIFADMFSFEDAAALCGYGDERTAQALAELTAASLVARTELAYRMLLPIQAVARRMLAARPNRAALDEAFAARMTALAEANTAEFTGPNGPLAFQRLYARYSDLTGALGWALKRPEERLERVEPVFTALSEIWAQSGRYAEGLRYVDRLETVAPRLSPERRGRIYYLHLRLAHAASDHLMMLEHGPLAISAFSIAGNRLGLARAYNALSIAALSTGKTDEAMSSVEMALRIYTQMGHERGIASALTNQANVLFDGKSDYARARVLYLEAIERNEAYGTPELLGIALGNLAELEHACLEYDRSIELARRAIEQFEAISNLAMIAWQHETLGRVALARGDASEARERFGVAADMLRRAPQPRYTAQLAEGIGRLALRSADPKAAARAFAAAQRVRREYHVNALGFRAREAAEDRVSVPAELAEAAAAEVERWPAGRTAEMLSGLLDGLGRSTAGESLV